MKPGDSRLVYGRMGKGEEKCNLGCKHHVEYYTVKRITVTHVVKVMIKALHYTHDGVGNEYHALDAQGRQYVTRDHWDGPRAIGWVRQDDKKVFFTSPFGEICKDVNGRLLK